MDGNPRRVQTDTPNANRARRLHESRIDMPLGAF
jgi:hypothetical protein